MMTPVDGEATDQEYDVGELLADAVKDIGEEGLEQATVGPVIGFITGACAKPLIRIMPNKSVKKFFIFYFLIKYRKLMHGSDDFYPKFDLK